MLILSLRSHWPSTRYANENLDGELSLKLRFNLALAAPMSVYVFAISSARIGVDQSRRVTVESLGGA